MKNRANHNFSVGPHALLNLPLTTKCLKKLRKRQKEVHQQETAKYRKEQLQNAPAVVSNGIDGKERLEGGRHLAKHSIELNSFHNTDFEKVLVWVPSTKVRNQHEANYLLSKADQ